MQHTSHLDDQPSTFERLWQRAEDFVRSRTSDHWLMFIGGLLVGLLLG